MLFIRRGRTCAEGTLIVCCVQQAAGLLDPIITPPFTDLYSPPSAPPALDRLASNNPPSHVELYSTNDTSTRTSFEDAVFRALPKDKGLYMPVALAPLPEEFWRKLPTSTLPEIGVAIAKQFVGDEIDGGTLEAIVQRAIDFPAPLVPFARDADTGLSNYVLDLTRGPSLAFKDFGARFMSGVMTHFLKRRGERLLILVATSGDTGGAVAAGFHGSENVRVIILYPKGGVSDVQEAQLTTLGGNVTALRVEGTFDDCQALVKEAFVDEELRNRVSISSANSINMARLVPQSFYYVEAYRQWLASGHTDAPIFSVPSGNFGNLTAGLFAAALGLPVKRFIAATNANDTVVRYAETGQYEPRPSVATISNAMDVGAPSNYVRLSTLLGSTWNGFRERVYAARFDDGATEAEMLRGFRQNPSYVLDPHTAVGMLALRKYQAEVEASPGIVLGTAHAGKFRPDVERVLGTEIEMPEALTSILEKEQVVEDVPNEYAALKQVVERVWGRRYGGRATR